MMVQKHEEMSNGHAMGYDDLAHHSLPFFFSLVQQEIQRVSC